MSRAEGLQPEQLTTDHGDDRSDPLPLGRDAPQGLGQGASSTASDRPCGGRSASGGSSQSSSESLGLTLAGIERLAC